MGFLFLSSGGQIGQEISPPPLLLVGRFICEASFHFYTFSPSLSPYFSSGRWREGKKSYEIWPKLYAAEKMGASDDSESSV